MKDLNPKLKSLGTENAFAVSAEVEKLRAKGKNIVSFCIGEPDFDTPSNVKEAGVKAINDNKTHYANPYGIKELRVAVADYVTRTRGIETKMEDVIICSGVKPAIVLTLELAMKNGDEVIYPNPGYPGYYANIDFLGGKSVALPLLEEKNFRFSISDLEKRITDKTKMIILNSPQNPTGGVLTKEDIQSVAELAKAKDLYVMADEVYSRILYEGKHHSIYSEPGMKERTFLLDGWSKIYAMTGWRLGFIVARPDLIEILKPLSINMVSSVATPNQYAGLEALTGPQEDPSKMVAEFKERRDLIVNGLNSIQGVSCKSPQGAFYVFPNVTRLCKDMGLPNANFLYEYLLSYAGVAVLPRNCFGEKNEGEKDEYIRFSFATSKANINEGLSRIKKAVNDKEMVKQYMKEKFKPEMHI